MLFALLCLPWASLAASETVERWVRSFADSELVFSRSTTNVPFQPLAFVDVTYYNDAEVRRPGGSPLSYDQVSVSQAAVLPVLLGPRNVLLAGEWIGWSRFDARNPGLDSFDVLSVALPVGWLQQADDRWQAGAFVAPLGHHASLADSSWSWETLGGVFGRYLQSDRLWWAFGLYLDIGPGEDVYLPYLGASWEINDRWTLSAVMPWPAVLFAPDRDTLFRLGATPSGASWSLRPGSDRVTYNLDSWDLGLSAERRVHGDFWLALEAGIGGMRTLRVTEGDLDGPELDIDASAYVTLAINFRPGMPD